MSLYRSFFPIAFFAFLIFGSLFSKKVRRGLSLRKNLLKASKLPKLNECFWIHAASGEYEYARPLIKELKKHFPQIPVVVSFFSPSYFEALKKDPLIDHALPLPFDFPGAIKDFIKKINPKAFFIARTDLWAEALEQCQRKNIPRILFSYYQNPQKKGLELFLRSWLLKKLSHIDCVDEQTLEFVQKNISKSATAFGDTRYDRVIERMEKPIDFSFKVPQKKVITFGSSWSEDEQVFIPALKDTKEQWELCFIAPHEPSESNIKQLAHQLKKSSLSFELFSEIKNDPKASVVIVDKVGVLFDLYRFSDLAFVGGSFRKTVHSVMEPLSQGSKLILGPKIQNNAEALEFKQVMVTNKTPAITVAKNTSQFSKEIIDHFSLKTEDRELIRKDIKELVRKKSGASEKLLKHLFNN